MQECARSKRYVPLLSFVLSCGLSFFATASVNGYLPIRNPPRNALSDLVLIYGGGDQRAIRWSPLDFVPYVSAVENKKEQWLFDAFAFIELSTSGSVTGPKAGAPLARAFVAGLLPRSGFAPAAQKEWTWLLDKFFDSSLGVRGLNSAISAAAKAGRIGKIPTRKRQVVITIPSPILPVAGKIAHYDWGIVDGRVIDASLEADRLTAVKWYIDQALRRWPADAPNLDFVGFNWIEETAYQDLTLLPKVADYVHSKNKKFFWIPSWRGFASVPAGDWKSLGFNSVYVQPNYFQDRPELRCYSNANDLVAFKQADPVCTSDPLLPQTNFHSTARGYSYYEGAVGGGRIISAAHLAKAKGMGLEMEFDSRVSSASGSQTSTYFNQRLEKYLKGFDSAGVGANASVAYYEGTGTLWRLAKSTNVADQALYHKIAQWILRRQVIADPP